MSINFGQFPTPRLPLQGDDRVVGYQLIGSVPTLAQYTLTQMFLGVFPGGVVPVSSGGTGLSTVPVGDLLAGNGTNPMTLVVPGTAGQVVISQGPLTAPVFGNNPVIVGGSVNSTPIGGTTPSTGVFTTVVSGSVFSNGGAIPAVTASGVQTYNNPSATVQFIDSVRSANNKNVYMQWGATTLAMGFGNDAMSAFSNFFTVTGGQAAGISGITSNSGTGTWAHTGAMSVTGTFTPSQTNGIVGTTTNNNANAGSVGEFVFPASPASASITSSTPTNVLSVALSAGDWDVQGGCFFVPSGSLVNAAVSISTASATTGPVGSTTQVAGGATGVGVNISTPLTRLSLAVTTTVFLVGNTFFSSGTATTQQGFIRARRIR